MPYHFATSPPLCVLSTVSPPQCPPPKKNNIPSTMSPHLYPPTNYAILTPARVRKRPRLLSRSRGLNAAPLPVWVRRRPRLLPKRTQPFRMQRYNNFLTPPNNSLPKTHNYTLFTTKLPKYPQPSPVPTIACPGTQASPPAFQGGAVSRPHHSLPGYASMPPQKKTA